MKRRRKPDLMLILVTVIGLGVAVTGVTQELLQKSPTPTQVTSIQR